ncbi:ATP-binding cassette domain-containing protein [Rhodococcoides kyotonense]|uniref:ATP-binding cassette domain-containing protein n=1 Tax=Rhodococcoides kyotonense TaxID=398843 RepID=UPI001594F034|nr:ATP-binding cassette domain-containing protein [Rhodococcus kyotonensis]
MSREGCEKAVVAGAVSETVLTLAAPLVRAHDRFEPVTAVLGGMIHVYRAANINEQVPPDEAFTVLGTRSVDPDQLSTYYTDSVGNSNYWYRITYYNAVTLDETALKDSTPTRGDDFGHYASLSEIRKEAGFENAYNLSDTVIDQQRRAAEAEINTAFANLYTVPFQKVPEIVHTLTIKLAAAILVQNQYPGSSRSTTLLGDARAAIKTIQDGDQTIVGEDGFLPAAVTAIVGPSGSGKSSLLHVLAGVDIPSAGSVSLGEVPIEDVEEGRRHRSILLIQQRTDVLAATVRANLQLSAPGATDATLLDALESAHLRVDLDVNAQYLSGGEKQRLRIAHAFLSEAPVILFDEPTSALDHDTAASVVGRIGCLARSSGKTVVMVTHDNDIRALADDSIVLGGARVPTSEVSR